MCPDLGLRSSEEERGEVSNDQERVFTDQAGEELFIGDDHSSTELDKSLTAHC